MASREMDYEETQAVQHEDEAVSWVDCRMLRYPFAAGGDWDYRALMLVGQKVIADLLIAERPDGLYVQPSSAFSSLVDERVTEHGDNGLRKQGWLPAKLVRYNTISNEVIVLRRPSRKRGDSDE